jgi:hypothetical protein
MNGIELVLIGTVESPLTDVNAAPRQADERRLSSGAKERRLRACEKPVEIAGRI